VFKRFDTNKVWNQLLRIRISYEFINNFYLKRMAQSVSLNS
jgi:hypothetical protein